MRLRKAVQGSKVCLILMLILSSAAVFAQDPQFSQYYANPIYTNPAFAGSSGVGRGVINYRSQWPSISGTFRTFSTSYDEHYDAINGGLAFMVTGDEAGVGALKTFSFNVAYSYQIIINKSLTIRLGLQGGYFQKSVDFSKFIFFDQIAASQGVVRPTAQQPPANPIYYANVSSGLLVYTNKFYGGFALHNMNEPNQSFYNNNAGDAYLKVKMRYTVHGGFVIPITRSRDESKSSNLWPNILYMQQGTGSNMVATQLNLGMYYNKGPLVMGMYFRQIAGINSDAVILLAGFRLPKMRFGFSYDATVSDARYGAKQSYEVSLAFELRKRAHKKTFRNIRCPEF